jgi:hypothetical protein
VDDAAPDAEPEPEFNSPVGGFLQGRLLEDIVKYDIHFDFVKAVMQTMLRLKYAFCTLQYYRENCLKTKGGSWAITQMLSVYTESDRVARTVGKLVPSPILQHELLALREGDRYLPVLLTKYIQALASGDYGFVCHYSDLLSPATDDQNAKEFVQIFLPQLPLPYVVLEKAEHTLKAMSLARKMKLVRLSP